MNGSTGFVHERKPKPGDKLRPWVQVRSLVAGDEGLVFEITRMLVDDTAELRLYGGAGRLDGDIYRPLASLRRIPRVNKNKPPIEGMPKDRPRCAWCDKLLRPRLDIKHEDGNYSKRVLRRIFLGWNAYEDLFCTSTCAVRFAGASYRGGYRRVKK